MKRKSALSLFATVALVMAVVTAVAQPPPPPTKPEDDGQPITILDGEVESSASTIRFIPSVKNPPTTRVILSNKMATKPVEKGQVISIFRKAEGVEAELVTVSSTLIQKLAEAESDSQRQELRNKLTEILGKQFDARQARHKQEIDTLEAQVQKLKELVKKREENRSEIISRRLEQMIRDSQGLGF